MSNENTMKFIENVLDVMPSDWINLTTYRLDIYNEKRAKVQFLEEFEKLKNTDLETLEKELKNLPTAFDYIRLGHPLSCILEWVVAKSKNLNVENVISFSSQSMPILAILRKNLLQNINTQIVYQNELPRNFDVEILKDVYGYKFELAKMEEQKLDFDGSTILIIKSDDARDVELKSEIDFVVAIQEHGSITLVNDDTSKSYISEIQHVRRRESIAMTPDDCLKALQKLVDPTKKVENNKTDTSALINTIKSITNTNCTASIGSCGLSVQYAIMMGLIHDSMDKHKGKAIKFIVPPNCYGGTNDQARRVAACIPNVEVLDLPVDGGQDMVQSVQKVLDDVALMDGVPFIIAEIPTNPRVEVPHLNNLRDALSVVRKTKDGGDAILPVFILDQTFCPNVKFLGVGDFLENVATISYVSGSKFPSGGLCTAGYCVANKKAQALMSYVDRHLKLCDNVATDFQLDVLTTQMPSMNKRIDGAYKNTREFVNFIEETLPTARINFVSEQLANDGFTPSVFSLDLPSVGETHEERESHKRSLNLKLINLMIKEIPSQSKFCVSYGQLKGCYWTIPATSTQGTTKEGDKDYIVRVSISPEIDLDHHKRVFSSFCHEFIK
jgi:cystathionine beta-lyase/cystathionine gamma-synthase